MPNYRICIDQNGDPYLAHIGLNRGTSSGGWGSHKYIATAQTSTGKRYFYTPEQIRAYQEAARQRIANAAQAAKQKAQSIAKQAGAKVKDWAGVDERERRDAARKKSQKTLNDWNTAQRRAWKRTAESTEDTRETRGLSPEQRANAEARAWDDANKKQDAHNAAVQKTVQAERDYDRTLLGKADIAKDYTKLAKDRVKDSAGTVKDTTQKMKDDYKKKAAERKAKKEEQKKKNKPMTVTIKDKDGNVTQTYEGKEARRYLARMGVETVKAIHQQRKIKRMMYGRSNGPIRIG